MDLKVDLESTRFAYNSEKEQETREEEGQDVSVVFKLPGGKESQHPFKAGLTVAYLKLHLQQQYGYAITSITLQMNGRTLLDPLSLSDCPSFQASAANVIDVLVA